MRLDTLTAERERYISSYMRHLMNETAMRWCDADACACLGCANRSGGLERRGITKEEWLQWWQKQVERMDQ